MWRTTGADAATLPSVEEESPPSFTPPALLGELRLLRRLGGGGMGDVYLAHDALLDRMVAVKFLRAVAPDDGARQRLLAEARAAARIQHPNVVTIHRVGEVDGRPFIVSELVRGESLDRTEKPMPWRRALEIGAALARGLAAAHRRGVLHLDIKPGNAILSDDGDAKLLDFGLSRMAAEPGSEAPAAPARAGVTSGERSAALDAVVAETMPDSPSGTALGGTPLYMPPELWLGEPATRRSDVYSLGALLYELCAGAAPHADVPVRELPRVVPAQPAPPLMDVAWDVDPGFAAAVERCLRIDPAERFASGDALREALEQLLARGRGAEVPEGNPYRGLLAFEMEHRALFFGRGSEAGTLIERLRSESFVLVTGDSGVGKSSLCRAGVLPLVLEGALGDGRAYTAARVVPGRRPVAALAEAIGAAIGAPEAALAEVLRAAPASIVREVRARLGARRGLVLLCDQLEELSTVSDPGEAALAGEALAALGLHAQGVRLLATVRADFLARVSSIPGLGEEIARALYFLRPMSPEKIREAIVGPARAKGVAFESEELVEMLVDSTASAEAGLPLLQFALAELWDARPTQASPLSAAALTAMGGVAGALARHADHVVAGLPDAQRAAARRLLGALVTPAGTRARRDETELGVRDSDARAALEALVRGRLICAREGERGAAYEIAHEALIREWGTLRRWLEEQADGRAARERLTAAAAEWERLERSRDALFSERQLGEAAILDRAELGAREAAFLDASRRALRRRRIARRALIIGLPLLAVLLYAGLRIQTAAALDARVAARIEDARAFSADAARRDAEVEALRSDAFAAFDGQRREEGERLWERALALASEADRLHARAGQQIEAALALDPGRDDVRTTLADLLYARAFDAERDGRAAVRDELLQRLSTYDEGGARTARWAAPGRLTIASDPPGAEVTVARYRQDPEGRRVLDDARALGAAPVAELELAQGSYLLTLAAPGRAAVRYPVLLRRGDALRVEVPLPRVEEVPEGYIYIPPGRSLFGTAADGTLRSAFLMAAPMHDVTTGGYLIARDELTFAQWIEYVEATSGEGRPRRGIRVGKGAIGGTLELRPQPGEGWRIELQSTTVAVAARSGEPIVYPGRKLRAAQDWRRFPVAGITAADAQSFTDWLDRSGRLPGARLCTEHEWERAARGADDRAYPHGDSLQAGVANFDETYGKGSPSMGPDEVGSHPASRSPFGVDDLAGNILEWVSSSLVPGEVVVRGGAYFYDSLAARVDNRTVLERTFADAAVGLRVCASFPPSR